MKKRFTKLAAALIAVMLFASALALAEGTISTTVLMRVSRMTQNAVVKAGVMILVAALLVACMGAAAQMWRAT
jgi:hypothetical protein